MTRSGDLLLLATPAGPGDNVVGRSRGGLQLAWPEQVGYELIRPVVLFGFSPVERAKQTGVPGRTLRRKADRFDAEGMSGLLQPSRPTAAGVLSSAIRRATVEQEAEYPAFRPHEPAGVCCARFGHRPGPHTVKRVLAEEPVEVLGRVSGTVYSDEELRRFFAPRFARRPDLLGYARLRHRRIHGERGLAGEHGAVRLYGEHLTVHLAEEPLAHYKVAHERDRKGLKTVTEPRLLETQSRSPQLLPRELGPDDRQVVMRPPGYAPRRRRRGESGLQLPLLPPEAATAAQ